MSLKTCLLIILPFYITFAQGPGESYNPMTAPGARGVPNGQSHWVNPPGVIFNELYISTDSLLVANLDTSVRKLNGFPSTVYSSVYFNNLFELQSGKKYFWRIVNHDLTGISASPVWYFRYAGEFPHFVEDFNNEFTNWNKIGPQGTNNWNISSTSNAGDNSPELRFSFNPIFNGSSYLVYKQNFNIDNCGISFKYSVDWWDWPNGMGYFGLAFSVNEGITWQSIWEITYPVDTNQVFEIMSLPAENNVEIAFYYQGNSNNINNIYIDNVILISALSPPSPPNNFSALYDTSLQKINLNWNTGSSPDPIRGYRIQRKEGLPNSLNQYIDLVDVSGVNTLTFMDSFIEANKIYTYRVRVNTGPPGGGSSWSNEATVYTPSIVPVELSLFNGYVKNNNVILNWSTSSETNNMGFEVLRKVGNSQLAVGNEEWKNIGFVNGKGTTTEFNNYSFNDNNLSAGKYKYKLKQIDFDGKFVYTDIIEFEIINFPEQFELLQNYPNPFNPSTTIKFSIPNIMLSLSKHDDATLRQAQSDIFVSLKVYDVLGNEIKTLVNEFKEAGNYSVEFDGSQLTSGFYIYKLSVGDFISTKKMILMK